MNILLVELDCFEHIENKTFHYSANSLCVAINLLNTRIPKNAQNLQVYILAKKDSQFAKIAQDKGINVLHLPEGSFTNLKLAFLLRKHKFDLIHSFDIHSAKTIAKIQSYLPKTVTYAHSENRLSEENSVFNDKAFKKFDNFIFADSLFQRYYSPSLFDRKANDLPIVLSEPKQKEQEEDFDKEELTPVAPLTHAEKYSANIPYANEFLINCAERQAKARFLLPLAYVKEDRYKEILQLLKLFDTTSDYEWEAYFYGLGNELETFIEYAQELNISEKLIAFHAYENEDAYKFCDLCILTLPQEEYVLSPLLLAWKHSIPILSNKVITYCKPAKHNDNLYVVDTAKKEAFVKAMLELLENNELRTRLTNFGKETYKHTVPLAKAYYSMYQEIIKNKKA